jgi:glycosyltransferase involved in cell wall biosynthesis
MYSISDVIADDFGVGWFGSASLEALSCAKPLLNYVDSSIMSENYPWHPFLSSKDADELAEIIKDLYGNPSKVQEIGANGRRWVQEFHSAEPIKQRYLALIRQMIENRAQL